MKSGPFLPQVECDPPELFLQTSLEPGVLIVDACAEATAGLFLFTRRPVWKEGRLTNQADLS